MEKLYFCNRCEYYCDPEYNGNDNICPECNSKMRLIEGTTKDIDKFLSKFTGKYDEIEDYL